MFSAGQTEGVTTLRQTAIPAVAGGIGSNKGSAAPAVRRPVIEVGLILIQCGSSATRPQDRRPRSVSRWISSSDSTSSVNPLTTTLHPEWVGAL